MPRVKPGGWTLNEKLSSADITQLDVNVADLGVTVYETGVRRQETFVDAAALRLAPFADGDVVYVRDVDLFFYDENSIAVDNGVSVIKPTGVGTMDPGRWFAIQRSSRNVPNGIVGLDAAGRTPAGLANYGTIYRDAKITTHAPWSRVSPAINVFPSTAITTPSVCNVGDIVKIRYNLAAVDFVGMGTGWLQISMSVAGGWYFDLGAPHRLLVESISNFTMPVAAEASYTLPPGTPASSTVAMRLTCGASDGTLSGYANSISYDIEVIRP